MKDKSWILGLVIVVAVIVALGVWGFKSNTNKTPAENNTPVANYYSDDANVMEFYQDSCSWCIKEQSVLSELGAQGYKVKPMNIGANYPDHQGWWKDYNISGTPTFVAKNGDRLEGYQAADKLKAFLDSHK